MSLFARRAAATAYAAFCRNAHVSTVLLTQTSKLAVLLWHIQEISQNKAILVNSLRDWLPVVQIPTLFRVLAVGIVLPMHLQVDEAC